MGLTPKGRTIIAKRRAGGDSATEIAKGLGFAPGTIYAELARGHTGQLDRNSRPQYVQRTGKRRMTIAQFCEENRILADPAELEGGKREKAG